MNFFVAVFFASRVTRHEHALFPFVLVLHCCWRSPFFLPVVCVSVPSYIEDSRPVCLIASVCFDFCGKRCRRGRSRYRRTTQGSRSPNSEEGRPSRGAREGRQGARDRGSGEPRSGRGRRIENDSVGRQRVVCEGLQAGHGEEGEKIRGLEGGGGWGG